MADDTTYTLTLDCDWWFMHNPDSPVGHEMYTPRIEQRKVHQNESVGILPTPKRPGYEFLGWWMVVPDVWETKWVRTKDQLESNEQYPWDFDATYYAKWKAVQCTIDWDSNEGSAVVQPNPWHTFYDYPLGYINVEHVLPATTRTGYDFVGWFTKRIGGVQVYPTTLADKDMTLYAHWTVKMCKVTFTTNNDDVVPTKVVEYGTKVYPPLLHWTGYTLDYWTVDPGGEHVKPEDEYVEARQDTALTAHWETVDYPIVWNFNGHGEKDIRFKDTYTIKDYYPLPEPEAPGYTFHGWMLNGLPATEISLGSVGSRTFVAQDWTANEYDLTFDPNFDGAEAIMGKATYDQPLDELPDPPEREDYEFLGWFTESTGGVQVHAGDIYRTADDATYYAHWRKLVTTYTVKFHKNDPTAQGYMPDETMNYKVATQLPPNRFWRSYVVSYIDRKEWPNQTDQEVQFKFIGWSTTPNGDVEYMDEESMLREVTEGATTGEIINLYAKWMYAQIVLPNAEHEGYVLDGWYTAEEGGERVGGPGQIVTISSNMVLFARFTTPHIDDEVSSNITWIIPEARK